jgi:hypothetical protein
MPDWLQRRFEAGAEVTPEILAIAGAGQYICSSTPARPPRTLGADGATWNRSASQGTGRCSDPWRPLVAGPGISRLTYFSGCADSA